MKKLKVLLILLLFFIPISVYAEPLTPQVDATQKIYDYADLLTDEEEKTLYNKVEQFIENHNLDLVLVTISENPYGVSDDYTKEYAQDFYDYNDFGIGNTHDGLIILIDMANRYPYIATTGQAILIYDDSRINNMHDAAFDYLVDGKYFEAFNTYVESSEGFASNGIPDSNSLFCIDENGNYYMCKTLTIPKRVNWALALLVGFIVALATLLIHLAKYKGIRLATNADSYVDKVKRGENVDQFLTTFTSRVKRSHDNGRIGGGHRGGGSSISIGSSGRSHGGGGGRHF